MARLNLPSLQARDSVFSGRRSGAQADPPLREMAQGVGLGRAENQPFGQREGQAAEVQAGRLVHRTIDGLMAGDGTL